MKLLVLLLVTHRFPAVTNLNVCCENVLRGKNGAAASAVVLLWLHGQCR